MIAAAYFALMVYLGTLAGGCIMAGLALAAGACVAGLEADYSRGKGVDRMKPRELLNDIGICILCAVPLIAYAMFFYFI